MPPDHPSPGRVVELGLGFQASKTLLTATELGVFESAAAGKREILATVSETVNPGGAVVVYGTMIDEERRDAELPLLMSLNMLLETPDGFDYTAGECIEWLHDAGFEGGEASPLPGPETMVQARK